MVKWKGIMKRTCKQCGKEFALSESEIRFYQSKGLELPKRCKSCRDKNKGSSAHAEENQKIVSASQSSQHNQNYQNQNPHRNDKSYVVVSAVAALLVLLVFVLKSVFAIPAEDTLIGEDVVSSGIQAGKEKQPDTVNGALPKAVADAPEGLSLPEKKDGTQPKEQPAQETDVQIHPDAQKETPSETEIAAAAAALEAAGPAEAVPETSNAAYCFRKAEYLTEHFQKQGAEFPKATEEEYLLGANNVIQNPNALHKLEAEDGDDVYYVESTGEFVVVSTDGYIRTYFIAALDYYNRQ